MKIPYAYRTECCNATTNNKALQLGYACMIMFMCKRSAAFQMRTLDFWLVPAIDHQQIIFLFDSTAQPIGYVIWAHLSEETEQRMLTEENFLLHPSEWNEGGRTWIIDFCFPKQKISLKTLKKIAKGICSEKIYWTRIKKNQKRVTLHTQPNKDSSRKTKY